MPQNTYWRTSRIAPPTGSYALVLGIQDEALHVILDSPIPDGEADFSPNVTVTTDRGEMLQWRGTTGVGTGGISGSYIHVAVFDPPPPGSEILNVVVMIGDATVLNVRALPVYTSG